MRRAALAALAFLAAAPLAAQEAAPVRRRTTYEDLQLFSQVLNHIRVNHPDSVDTHALFMGAVEGLLSAADPHSYVMPAGQLRADLEQLRAEGKLFPVPVTFEYIGGSPVVVGVAPGSGAARQDIYPGDELVAIDGAPVRAESAEALAVLLSGRKGSTVRLQLARRRGDGTIARVERTVAREKVGEGTAVPAAVFLGGGAGYVRVTTFVHERVVEDLRRAIGRLRDLGMTRLVLDLRDNGGGSVTEAGDLASEFLPKGTLVYTAGGPKEKPDSAYVKREPNAALRDLPIAVLVNKGTASASELVAGALQDHDRAVIVGRTSFGKSLMMRGFPLSDGSVVMLVVGQVKTPCGRAVQRQYRGVTRRDYYRLDEAARDTAGRPSCRTANGRTVYGGGGIHPDVVLPPPAPAPRWLARAREEDLVLQWVGGWVGEHPLTATDAKTFATSPELAAAAEGLRATLAARGIEVPADADAAAVLRRAAGRAVAFATWGEAGLVTFDALLDAEVAAAVAALDRAGTILAAPAR